MCVECCTNHQKSSKLGSIFKICRIKNWMKCWMKISKIYAIGMFLLMLLTWFGYRYDWRRLSLLCRGRPPTLSLTHRVNNLYNSTSCTREIVRGEIFLSTRERTSRTWTRLDIWGKKWPDLGIIGYNDLTIQLHRTKKCSEPTMKRGRCTNDFDWSTISRWTVVVISKMMWKKSVENA